MTVFEIVRKFNPQCRFMYMDTNFTIFFFLFVTLDTNVFQLEVCFVSVRWDSGVQKLYCFFSFVINFSNYNRYMTQHLIT